MAYYKISEEGYIRSVGQTERPTKHEISYEEYSAILSVIHAKPPATETTDYRLREDLTWEEYPVDPPDPDPEIDGAEAWEILFGGAE